MRFLLKTLAWVFVATCWLFYGWIIWLAISHPHPEIDPVTNFREGLKRAHDDWGISLFLLIATLLYCACRIYLAETKEEKQQNEKKTETNDRA